MRYERFAISGYDISFIVLGQSDTPVGGLSISPFAIKTEDPGAWSSYLIDIDITMRHEDFLVNAQDYLRVGSFVDLRDRLIGYEKGNPGDLEIGTVEPNMDLQMRWCELGKD